MMRKAALAIRTTAHPRPVAKLALEYRREVFRPGGAVPSLQIPIFHDQPGCSSNRSRNGADLTPQSISSG